MVELYLNNQLCDLYGSEEIATDYSIAPISNISSRNSSKSVSFKIPLTANNREIIENANVIVNATTLPYSLIPARLYANGLSQNLEFAVIKSIQDDIALNLYGSNIDFFQIIKTRKISDLGDDWNHLWNLTNIAASLLNTSGYIYSVIDFHSDSPNTYINNVDSEIDVRGLLPSIFLHSIITKIIEDAGFTEDVSFLTDADYRRIILPTNGEIGTVKPKMLSIAETASSQVLSSGIDYIELDQILFDPYSLIGTFNTVTAYQAPVEGVYSFRLTLTATFSSTATLSFRRSVDPYSSFIIYGQYPLISGEDKVIEVEGVPLLQGQVFAVSILSGSGVTVAAGAKLEVTDTGVDRTRFGFYVDPLAAITGMDQSKILKDTAQKFNLIIHVDNVNRIVYLRQFSEIIANIPNALDWSEKVDYMEKPELQFNSDYGQRNTCKYKEDDTVTKPSGTDYEILINNANLKAELSLFESPFAASEQVERFGGVSIAQITLFTDLAGSVKFEKVESRYLTYRYENYSTFTLTDGTNTSVAISVPMSYFILGGQDFNLGFANNLIENSSYIIETIQNFKIVKMLLRLNASDINQLDFFRPVWIKLNGQSGCYFYVSEIKQFKVTSKESCDVELVKLP